MTLVIKLWFKYIQLEIEMIYSFSEQTSKLKYPLKIFTDWMFGYVTSYRANSVVQVSQCCVGEHPLE